jgi:hypothetical protein
VAPGGSTFVPSTNALGLVLGIGERMWQVRCVDQAISRCFRSAPGLVIVCILGCSPKNPDGVPLAHPPVDQSQVSRPVAPAGTQRAGGSTAAPHDTRAAASASPSVTSPVGAAPVLRNVNLLHMVPARVAVSSAVRNPHDFPEYLVDNHLETAWNGATGDLAGGWIDFQIPVDATVRSIEMTCGYSRVKGKNDFFVQNHRISGVEVLRDGKSLGEFPLDVNQRGLQTLPVTGPGGTYRILVKATVPGTRKDWRELAVSELRVMGDPGKELRAPNDRLQVAVGGLDNASPEEFRTSGMAIRDLDADAAAFATPEQLCAHFVQQAKAGAAELLSGASGRGVDKLDPPFCHTTAEEHAIPQNPIYARSITVRLSDGLWVRNQLVVQVKRGFVLIPVFWKSVDPLDPGCPSIFRTEQLEPIRVENGYLVVTEMGHRFLEVSEKGKPVFLTIYGATWCKEADAKLACFAYDPSNLGSLVEFSISPDGMLHIQGRGSN